MAAQIRSSVGPLPAVPRSFPSPATRPQRFGSDKVSSCRGFSRFRFASKQCRPGSAYSPSLAPTSTTTTAERQEGMELSETGGGGGDSWNSGGDGGGGDDWHDEHHAENEDSGGSSDKGGIFGAILQGWDDRVQADPQFPFKVLMEQIVGVGAAVLGDMVSRPNFGLNELDFVFSTLVVGSIVNFSLMYVLAPTSAASTAAIALPWIFASCPSGHMFEQGTYTAANRLGTFVYKGALFAAVGFGAGLFGTFLSNCLIGFRKKMDPTFEPQNQAPPTLLNATTWAIHMGVSSNLRYQVLNGIEFSLANHLPPPAFKASVLSLRAFNNILGGFTFVTLARLTGSQKKADAKDVSTLVETGKSADAQRSEEQAKVTPTSADDLESRAIAAQKLGLGEKESIAVGASAQGNDSTNSGTLISEMDIAKPAAPMMTRENERSERSF